MYEDLNEFYLTGNLTKDPEFKTKPNGLSICRISIANNQGIDKDGNKKETYFFNCIAFDKLAEHINNYYRKGIGVFVEGKWNQRSYIDETSGKKHFYYNLEIKKIKPLAKYSDLKGGNNLESDSIFDNSNSWE
jgi:single-strand DNA-binding protein